MNHPSDDLIWHGSPLCNLRDILRDGLRPGEELPVNVFVSESRVVFATSDKFRAFVFGQRKWLAQDEQRHKSPFVVLICIKKTDAMNAGFKLISVAAEGEFVCASDVPPKWISHAEVFPARVERRPYSERWFENFLHHPIEVVCSDRPKLSL